ncbi:hypothetical protein ACQZ4P_01060 [Agrobacterium vitis]
MALDILRKRNVDFEVDFFGWPLGKLNFDFPYRDLRILKSQQLAELYREATVGVVFSATNHSLVNKEMMACGLPVMDLRSRYRPLDLSRQCHGLRRADTGGHRRSDGAPAQTA